MKIFAFRLLPGMDLKKEIQAFLTREKIEAAALISAVGSLRHTRIRLAGAKEHFEQGGPKEILSLSGTLSLHGSHLHLAVSDESGVCLGGHLLDGCIINTTAELVVGELGGFVFRRTPDVSTGYDELQVSGGSSV